MPLQPPNNPFDSFTWLKEFNEAISIIMRKKFVGFRCEPFVTEPHNTNGFIMEKGKSDAAGNYTIGLYWLGFYYKIWNGQEPKRMALPWFGCQFVDEFTIDIIVHPITNSIADNTRLYKYLFDNEYSKGIHATHQKRFSCQNNSKPNNLLRCRFDDYMRITKGYSNFSFSNWICSNTQEADLEDFFETINTNFLVPYI